MAIEARGLPAHTRTLSVTLRRTAPAEEASSRDVDFSAYVLDLRKRGFVPVGGDIQGPGIIHHMSLQGRIDRAGRRIATIRADMPTVAFEATPSTGGESCRDRIDLVPALAGTSLAAGYATRLGAEIGGVRGCSHILTLAHLLGPTAAWALDCDESLNEHAAGWRPGERLFRRDVVIDGADVGGHLALVALLTDFHFRPQPAVCPATDRFLRQLELRLAARVTLPDMRVCELSIAERRRGRDDLETATWHTRDDRAETLGDLSFRAGIARELLVRLGDDPRDRPLLDLLLMLAPATLQCVASFIDTDARAGGAARAAAETGGHADSCYMWRRDGALQSRLASR